MRAVGRWALWALISMLVTMGLARAAALRSWRVPVDDPYLEASIAPTLRGGDLVLLWRLTPPELGALVVCPEPKHAERLTIGRMVGEERNQVLVEGSRVTVAGRAFSSEGDCANSRFKVNSPQNGAEMELSCSMEASSGVLHQRGNAPSTNDVPKLDLTLEDGEVALISDNRRFPYDSRDFGAVQRELCTETIFFRLLGADGFFDADARFQYIR